MIVLYKIIQMHLTTLIISPIIGRSKFSEILLAAPTPYRLKILLSDQVDHIFVRKALFFREFVLSQGVGNRALPFLRYISLVLSSVTY